MQIKPSRAGVEVGGPPLTASMIDVPGLRCPSIHSFRMRLLLELCTHLDHYLLRKLSHCPAHPPIFAQIKLSLWEGMVKWWAEHSVRDFVCHWLEQNCKLKDIHPRMFLFSVMWIVFVPLRNATNVMLNIHGACTRAGWMVKMLDEKNNFLSWTCRN